MVEIIKLAKLYKLEDLFQAAELHFSDNLVNWLDNSHVL